MILLNKRKGIAVVLVLLFAISIAIIMFTVIKSTTNLGFQTKQTIYEMQAYYLAHSAMQYGKLLISLLPKEIYDFYKNHSNSGGEGEDLNALNKCSSDVLAPLSFVKEDNYDLFNENCNDGLTPYNGEFEISSLEYILSNDGMSMVQDSYRMSVRAAISHDEGKKKFEIAAEPLTEEFIVSRYSGR